MKYRDKEKNVMHSEEIRQRKRTGKKKNKEKINIKK